MNLIADGLTGMPRPQSPYSCWRCGGQIPGGLVFPHYVCEPCLHVVSDEDLAWVNDPANQPGLRTWEMRPRFPR